MVNKFKAGVQVVDAECKQIAGTQLLKADKKRLFEVTEFEEMQAEHRREVRPPSLEKLDDKNARMYCLYVPLATHVLLHASHAHHVLRSVALGSALVLPYLWWPHHCLSCAFSVLLQNLLASACACTEVNVQVNPHVVRQSF